MKNLSRVLRTCALLVVVSSASRADSNVEGKVRQRIDLDLLDASAEDVFMSFGRILDAKLELSPAVVGKVTIRLQNVSLETAIDVICESIGCLSELSWGEDPILRILPVGSPERNPEVEALRQSLESPISVSLKDAAAMDVLVTFSKILKAELELQKGSTRTVTLELQGVPASQALDALAAILKVDWDVREETVDGRLKRILRISQRKPIAPVPVNGGRR